MIIKNLSQHNKAFDLILFCLVFLAGFGFFLYGYRYFDLGTYHYDEALSTYGAVRILDGSVPYRDFWSLYAPGQFFVLALIFKIFGISIKSARVFSVLVLALTASCVFLLLKRLCSVIFSFFTVFLFLPLMRSDMVYNRPGQLSILFFILCSLVFASFLKSGKIRWLIASGALLGLAGSFRQDFGIYIFISLSLAVFLKELNRHNGSALKEKLGSMLRSWLFLFLGSSIIILPLVIYLFANSALVEFNRDAIIFPIFIYSMVRALPLPGFGSNSLIFYLPLFVLVLTCVRLLFYDWRKEVNETYPWLLLFFLFSGIGLLNYSFTRVEMSHLLPALFPVIILFLSLFYDLSRTVLNGARSRYKDLILIPLCYILFFSLTGASLLAYSRNLNIPPKMGLKDGILGVRRAEGFYDGSQLAQSQAQAIRYIQANTAKDENIFVGNSRHDRIVNCDVMFYFLSERRSATKYYELHPGLTNTKEIQKRIINDLIKGNTKYIVLWSHKSAIDANEPNESSFSSGVSDLDDFIGRNYRIERIFGQYAILRRS